MNVFIVQTINVNYMLLNRKIFERWISAALFVTWSVRGHDVNRH